MGPASAALFRWACEKGREGGVPLPKSWDEREEERGYPVPVAVDMNQERCQNVSSNLMAEFSILVSSLHVAIPSLRSRIDQHC